MTNAGLPARVGAQSVSQPQAATEQPRPDRGWYAVFCVPQNEKSAMHHLGLREIEAFLPTYQVERVWKNRQRVKLTLPLFPAYLFVRISRAQRGRVLECPGILHIVGNGKEPLPLPDSEIEFLRAGVLQKRLEPCLETAIGQRVRIKSGPMQGVEGVLVRKKNSLRFVLTLDLINQRAAVEVAAEDLEPVASRAASSPNA